MALFDSANWLQYRPQIAALEDGAELPVNAPPGHSLSNTARGIRNVARNLGMKVHLHKDKANRVIYVRKAN